MKKLLLIASLFFVMQGFIVSAQNKTVQDFYDQAKEAYKKGNYSLFYEKIIGAHKLHPYHQGILFDVARAASLTSRPDDAIKFLTRAIYIDMDFDLSNPDFKSIANRDDFKSLLKVQHELTTPVIHSDTAVTVKDRQLHIEAVSPGETADKFYVSSVRQRKIVSVYKNGVTKDFTTAGQDGLASVMGLRIDGYRKALWVCSSPMDEMEKTDEPLLSAVYKYDLLTKKLIKKFPLVEPEMSCVLGDMCSDQKGGLYISDSKNNIIFRTNVRTGITDDFFTSPLFWNIQGVTTSPDGQVLFIADYIKGIFRLEIATKELIQVGYEVPGTLKSIDGLLFYKNSLVAIQNGVNPMRVMRYILNPTMDKITSQLVVDMNHPAFHEPTNGFIAGDILYYVANSQWSGYDEAHNIKPAAQLQDIVILKADLSKIK